MDQGPWEKTVAELLPRLGDTDHRISRGQDVGGFEACLSGMRHAQTKSTLTIRASVAAIDPPLPAQLRDMSWADSGDKKRKETAGQDAPHA